MTPVFVDGLGSVRIVNGMAHIELVTLAPAAADGQPPRAEVTQRLVMTLPHFVRFCSEMANQIQKMEQKGIITRNKPSG
jgi:hypothetical protein